MKMTYTRQLKTKGSDTPAVVQVEFEDLQKQTKSLKLLKNWRKTVNVYRIR
jgi:hypothetical protein